MKIFVTGNDARTKEFQSIVPSAHEAVYFPQEIDLDEVELELYDVIIDLNLDDSPENLLFYAGLAGKPVIGCAVKAQLAEMVYYLEDKLECNLIGFNALPAFINRPAAEVSLYNKEDKGIAEKIFAELSKQVYFVEDRVGMVTPRIVLMIINEAFYTLQEGTASAQDIDQSMKLGTNYPYGPFEWTEKIGIKEVYETLDAIYQDTHDERYKICPLLKTQYLRNK